MPQPSYRLAVCLLLLSLGAGTLTARGETPTLLPQLEPFRPYLGNTYRGEFGNSTAEKPMVDVQRWERALNGSAVRMWHSLNRGEYGGETLFFWDKSREQLRYYYFTTAGFYTEGTVTPVEGGFSSHESVTGNAQGITDVQSTARLHPDGSLTVTSAYLKDGEQVGGSEVEYQPAPDATVVFR